MTDPRTHDSRQATAERNVEAILDATEHLIQRRLRPSISAVAAEAGLSRVTVYSHFEDREGLLEAVVERAVRRVMAAIESAETERGEAVEALRRLVAASWQELASHEEIGRMSSAELSGDAMRRAHEPARAVILRLAERGQREGEFRTDVPASWLVTSCLALIHAAAEEVRAGGLDREAAHAALSVSVVDVFAGRR